MGAWGWMISGFLPSLNARSLLARGHGGLRNSWELYVYFVPMFRAVLGILFLNYVPVSFFQTGQGDTLCPYWNSVDSVFGFFTASGNRDPFVCGTYVLAEGDVAGVRVSESVLQ